MHNLVHGGHSEVIKGLQDRMNASPMNAVQKMEFDSMLSEMTAKSIAFDLDKFIKQQLISQVQSTDKKLMSYYADMVTTQAKLADMEQGTAFHKKVLMDLKEKYLRDESLSTLEEIDKREKTIKDFDRQISNLLELRNKIRKEIDKGQYQAKSLELKEKEQGKIKNITDVKNIDFEVLEFEE